MRRFGFLILLAVLVILLAPGPNVAHADSKVWPTGYWGPLLSCTGNYNHVVPVGSGGVKPVCTSFCDMLHTGQNVVDFAITLVLFVGAPAMITFGGIMLMVAGTAGGQESRNMAKDIIVSALIGVGITLGAYIILSTFLWLFGNGPTSAIQVSWPEVKCSVAPFVPPATGGSGGNDAGGGGGGGGNGGGGQTLPPAPPVDEARARCEATCKPPEGDRCKATFDSNHNTYYECVCGEDSSRQSCSDGFTCRMGGPEGRQELGCWR